MSTTPKSTVPKPFAFVLMPFDESFDDVYKLGIKPACKDAGAYCERVDEQIFDERILDRIYNQIAKADLVIADMTGRNANVFYEVGYAHAIGKLTILLTKNSDDIPFDLKHFPHIVYGVKISVLQSELEKRVKYFIENPPSKPSDIKLGIELYLEGQDLASGKAMYMFSVDGTVEPEITVFNASSETFTPDDLKIGIITSARFDSSGMNGEITTKLPNGGYLHMLPKFPTLFPNAYASSRAMLYSSHNDLAVNEEEAITVRLFTKQGHRDFQVIICAKEYTELMKR